MIALLGGCAFLLSPEPQSAVANDSYWNNYWGWYDNNYRPYYNRNYRLYNNYPYVRQYGFRYNSPYYPNYYRNDYYSPYYYNGHALRGPHNSVDVGGMHFDWR
jgi:hypothetical protein